MDAVANRGAHGRSFAQLQTSASKCSAPRLSLPQALVARRCNQLQLVASVADLLLVVGVASTTSH
eukprot:11018626-Heterocapsa_arctica.AAC.1